MLKQFIYRKIDMIWFVNELITQLKSFNFIVLITHFNSDWDENNIN